MGLFHKKLDAILIAIKKKNFKEAKQIFNAELKGEQKLRMDLRVLASYLENLHDELEGLGKNIDLALTPKKSYDATLFTKRGLADVSTRHHVEVAKVTLIKIKEDITRLAADERYEE